MNDGSTIVSLIGVGWLSVEEEGCCVVVSHYTYNLFVLMGQMVLGYSYEEGLTGRRLERHLLLWKYLISSCPYSAPA